VVSGGWKDQEAGESVAGAALARHNVAELGWLQ